MVDERFLDRRAGDLVADIDRDLVIADRERHVAAIDRGDQRAERLVDRRTAETFEPGRIGGELLQLVAHRANDARTGDSE